MRNIGQHILANFNKTSRNMGLHILHIWFCIVAWNRSRENRSRENRLAYLVLHGQHILATLRDTSRNNVLHLSAYFTLREKPLLILRNRSRENGSRENGSHENGSFARKRLWTSRSSRAFLYMVGSLPFHLE